MKFDTLKPNLQELNLNGVKKAASRVAHVRIRLSRGQWIGVIAGLVVVTVLLVVLLRPRPAVKRTFPLAMWVETPVKPVSSKSCRSLSIFTTRPPTFTARRKAAYLGTPRL